MKLKTVPGFIAKNQLGSTFRSFTVRSLKDFTASSGLEDEELMCPVRALRICSKRVIRDTNNIHLFVSFQKGHSKAIHQNTVSSWLKQCIVSCFEVSGKPTPTKVVGHSIRSMAVSWAALKNVSLQQILESCFWKSPNTFITFYLKDLTEIEGNINRLGKVSVTSTIV